MIVACWQHWNNVTSFLYDPLLWINSSMIVDFWNSYQRSDLVIGQSFDNSNSHSSKQVYRNLKILKKSIRKKVIWSWINQHLKFDSFSYNVKHFDWKFKYFNLLIFSLEPRTILSNEIDFWMGGLRIRIGIVRCTWFNCNNRLTKGRWIPIR